MSNHIKVLERAALVERRKVGREHLLAFRAGPLGKCPESEVGGLGLDSVVMESPHGFGGHFDAESCGGRVGAERCGAVGADVSGVAPKDGAGPCATSADHPCMCGRQSEQDRGRPLGVERQTVGKWRRRLFEHRIDGIRDEPRSGAPRTIEDARIESVIVRTLESLPPDASVVQ